VLLPGVAKAIVALKQAGKRVIVVTNQRGVALGRYTAEDVRTIHERLQQLLAGHGAQVDAFYFCPHDKKQCQCRKPLPGMFEQARAEFPQITAESSVMVGDSLSDIEFGQGVGMRTIFIQGDTEHRKPGWERGAELADLVAADLPDAVRQILNRTLTQAEHSLIRQ
jgi:D-glycero-D-manno-heptose 1,7-bisphosphate phosphatase